MCLPIIKHDMINGNTINFRVLRKSSPGYEISVMDSLLRCNGLKVNPEIKSNKQVIHF